MIKCDNTDCTRGHCCVECDAQMPKDNICGCNIAEDLQYDRDDTLKYCQFAIDSGKEAGQSAADVVLMPAT